MPNGRTISANEATHSACAVDIKVGDDTKELAGSKSDNSMSATSRQNSRDRILTKIRAALPQSSPLPELEPIGPWQTFDDRESRFAEVLKFVGGQAVHVRTLAEADAHLKTLEPWTRAVVRCTLVPGVGDCTFDLNAIDDPHELENVGFAVLRGEFCVAENGAIWVTDAEVRHRVLYFISQHISLVVPASQIVNNLHEAYARLNVGAHRFAGFISGPSKTADIEQSLVIGAHGARSLTVYLVEELDTAG